MISAFIHIQGSLHRDISLLPLRSQELGSLLATLQGGHGWAVPWSVRWLGEGESLHSVLAAGNNAQEILCAHGGKTELLRIPGHPHEEQELHSRSLSQGRVYPPGGNS